MRAWHGHKYEEKYLTVVLGAAKVGAVAIDDWDNPSKTANVREFVLTGTKPATLHIPAGFANGFMSLTDDTVVLVFSTASLAESRDDDFRFPARHWDIWKVTER